MKKACNVFLFLLFNCILAVSLIGLNYVLRNKEYEGAQDKFKKWNPQNADIVFIGNSHQFCSVSTDLLYDEYGIESYMLATSAQTVPMSYYAAMEAIELMKPDTIVFEASYTANDFRTVDSMDHCFFDGFPNCKAKWLALKDLAGEDAFYYLFPLGQFHSRWKELSKADFEDFPVSKRGTTHFEEVEGNTPIPLADKSETDPMPEEMEKYMDLLVDLCKDNDVKLIIYVAPFNGLYDDEGSVYDVKGRQRVFNYLASYCEKKNVEYHNMFDEVDKLSIDDSSDWMDRQHFNFRGQEKFTRYMAQNGYFGF